MYENFCFSTLIKATPFLISIPDLRAHQKNVLFSCSKRRPRSVSLFILETAKHRQLPIGFVPPRSGALFACLGSLIHFFAPSRIHNHGYRWLSGWGNGMRGNNGVVPTARLIKVCGGEREAKSFNGRAGKCCEDKERLRLVKIVTKSINNAFGLTDKRWLKILLSW
jgi:hypothetical protein